MIKKIFGFLFKSGKKASESVGKSMDFIDDVLEKEYITSTVDKAKEASGKVVEKAGEAYQNTKEFIEDKVDLDELKEGVANVYEKGVEATSKVVDSAKDLIEDNVDVEKLKENVGNLVDKGKEATSDIADRMMESSSTLKNVMEEGKDIINKIVGNEEE